MTTEILPDDAALRAARRERVLAQMEAAGIDILITGREANARYIAGVPRLWLNGSRPFGPGCIYVRETGDIHLVQTWDEGVPPDIPHEHLHGITFNGANTVKMLQGVHGADAARTVATDGLMPSTARLIRTAYPNAELVDGEQLLREVRRIKLPEEIDAIRVAIGIAERALAAAEQAFAVGVTGRQLTGVFMEAMAEEGITTPTTQDVARISSRTEAWANVSRDTAIAADDLVSFDAGVLAGGYIGEVGRTRCLNGLASAAGSLLDTWDELWDRLVNACRAGAPATDLLDAYDASGLPAPPTPVARGLGHGNDLPLVSHALPKTAAEQKLEAGMVLALTGYVWQEGVGAVYGQEPVLITDSGPTLLSANPFREARS
ncbi:MAG: M24 family metallopeptidase [Frankiaceae bacterium]|nr:M24 family metallopeptidase [Frankiaceae bacterium]MBV9871351.1 M24 family metallopeptidase [Frankiaceae bacterium]